MIISIFNFLTRTQKTHLQKKWNTFSFSLQKPPESKPQYRKLIFVNPFLSPSMNEASIQVSSHIIRSPLLMMIIRLYLSALPLSYSKWNRNFQFSRRNFSITLTIFNFLTWEHWRIHTVDGNGNGEKKSHSRHTYFLMKMKKNIRKIRLECCNVEQSKMVRRTDDMKQNSRVEGWKKSQKYKKKKYDGKLSRHKKCIKFNFRN